MDYTYLTSLKNDFHKQLLPILSSNIYHQLKVMYSYSENIHPKLQKKKNLSFEKVFKTVLAGFEGLNNHEIEKQYYTVKMNSKCPDFFDNLVIASFKSYILFVTWDPERQISRFSDNEYFKKIPIKDFIHKCHVVSADYFINHTDLFTSKNKKDILDIICSCIEIAMIKMIPYNDMLNEYIENNFAVKINQNSNEINKIRNKVNNFIENSKYGTIPTTNIIKNENFKTNNENYSEEDGNDVNMFIDAQEKMKNFNAQLSHANNANALDDQNDDESEITMLTFMSRDDQKNHEIDNLIGDDEKIEADIDVESVTFGEKNEQKEEEEEIKQSSSHKNLILNSPPPIKENNKLQDMGVKNKLTIISNKKSRNNKFNEMDEYYNKQLI